MSLLRSHQASCRRKHNPGPAPALAAVLLAFVMPGAAADAAWLEDTRPLMGTEVRVRLWHADDAAGNAALEATFSEISRIERLMSTYIDDSRISELNRHAAERPVDAGEELFDLIVRALDVSVLTLGAFDITYDSVGQHYDYRARIRPDDASLRDSLPAIDYRLVEATQQGHYIRFLRHGVRINLGGIAKGYAVERGVQELRRHNVDHAIVTAGGDSRLLGDRRGQPWVVGVRDPRNAGRVVLRIPLEDEAISTSGDYERFFIEDDTRYHHILVPTTGQPAAEIRSATVIGPDAVLTDALSTSVFVMGVDDGLRLVGTLPDYEAVVIDAEGALFYSDGLRPPAQKNLR
ncbi:MAG: FAD:protein FMN transferase [Woeseia sp.]|nr:FAD:protein FMN transferase [Woeseia sp.]NNL54871.1 FAD:protein FMN transferase [Woeseia sp.]